MQNEPNLEEPANTLQDNVILLINGLSESGRVLTEMLAKQGSDVAIVDLQPDSELARRIRRDVQACGRSCLILTPSSQVMTKKPFPQYVIHKILDTFGRLDAFISYSAADSTKMSERVPLQNGRSPNTLLFDQAGLTKAALKHILTQQQ